MRLPPGFRFHPTDEELVDQYLKRKVYSCPLPASIIPEIDVCKFDPWDLPGDSEQERYFFTTRQVKYPNGNRSNRATSAGYWKATGIDKQIVASRGSQVVGMKKVLVFYRGRPPHGTRTDWIMHEYRLSDANGNRGCILPQRKNSIQQNSLVQMENWVLCRIFLKKRGTKNDVEATQQCNNTRSSNHGMARTVFIDFLSRQAAPPDDSPSSSSSNSSSITELSLAGPFGDDDNSSCDSFSSGGREA